MKTLIIITIDCIAAWQKGTDSPSACLCARLLPVYLSVCLSACLPLCLSVLVLPPQQLRKCMVTINCCRFVCLTACIHAFPFLWVGGGGERGGGGLYSSVCMAGCLFSSREKTRDQFLAQSATFSSDLLHTDPPPPNTHTHTHAHTLIPLPHPPLQ